MFITCHRYFTRLYVKRATHNSRKMIKKCKPDLFLNFRCGHGRTFCFHVCCSHSHLASFSTLPRKRSPLERLEMCFLKLKSVRSCALILKPNSVRWWERAHLCVLPPVCVCLCASWRNSAMRDTESRIVNPRPCRDRNYMPLCK